MQTQSAIGPPITTPAVLEEANEARGCDKDPLDLLIEFEGRADDEWRSEPSQEPKERFVNRYVRLEIDNL